MFTHFRGCWHILALSGIQTPGVESGNLSSKPSTPKPPRLVGLLMLLYSIVNGLSLSLKYYFAFLSPQVSSQNYYLFGDEGTHKVYFWRTLFIKVINRGKNVPDDPSLVCWLSQGTLLINNFCFFGSINFCHLPLS